MSLNNFYKKESPLISMLGMGGGASSLLTLASGEVTYVDDVFSTFLYTGTGAAQTITNEIDLDGEGGLVWIKNRSRSTSHVLFDTERGASTGTSNTQNKVLASNSTSEEGLGSLVAGISSFNSNGFTLDGSQISPYNANGPSTEDYVSWTFRKAPGFFDVVTYTGNSTAGRTVSHNLGSVPGVIIVKNLSSSNNWPVFHRSLGATKILELNESDDATTTSAYWNDTAPTSTNFTLGSLGNVNASGENFVAYLFAHNDGSFGEDSDEAVIKCGSFTSNSDGSTPTVDLGFEPQWVLFKNADNSQNWILSDVMRGFALTGHKVLLPNLGNADTSLGDGLVVPTSTGFTGTGNQWGGNKEIVYIAIRRPHKPPESGSEVYGAVDYTGAGSAAVTFDLGITVDTYLQFSASSTYDFKHFGARLLGTKGLYTVSGSAEFTGKYEFDVQTGLEMTSGTENTSNNVGTDYRLRGFKRAAKFHDVVTYAGNNTNPRSITHNLGVAPELIILKNRGGDSWAVYSAVTGSSKEHWLNSLTNYGFITGNSIWTGTDPTASVFYVKKDGQVNQSGDDYIAWLWASLAGVSKVGSYTGTGSNVDVDCGFTSGARFLLIRRTDAGGNYYVFDSERGIVSGNDPFIELDTSDSEVTNTDYIDPLNAGFTVTSSAPAGLNASGGTYLFLAVA